MSTQPPRKRGRPPKSDSTPTPAPAASTPMPRWTAQENGILEKLLNGQTTKPTPTQIKEWQEFLPKRTQKAIGIHARDMQSDLANAVAAGKAPVALPSIEGMMKNLAGGMAHPSKRGIYFLLVFAVAVSQLVSLLCACFQYL